MGLPGTSPAALRNFLQALYKHGNGGPYNRAMTDPRSKHTNNNWSVWRSVLDTRILATTAAADRAAPISPKRRTKALKDADRYLDEAGI